MLSHDDYTPLKHFVTAILQNSTSVNPIIRENISIIKLIKKVVPIWQIKDIVESCFIKQVQLNNDVVIKLRSLLIITAEKGLFATDGIAASSSKKCK